MTFFDKTPDSAGCTVRGLVIIYVPVSVYAPTYAAALCAFSQTAVK